MYPIINEMREIVFNLVYIILEYLSIKFPILPLIFDFFSHSFHEFFSNKKISNKIHLYYVFKFILHIFCITSYPHYIPYFMINIYVMTMLIVLLKKQETSYFLFSTNDE